MSKALTKLSLEELQLQESKLGKLAKKMVDTIYLTSPKDEETPRLHRKLAYILLNRCCVQEEITLRNLRRARKEAEQEVAYREEMLKNEPCCDNCTKHNTRC